MATLPVLGFVGAGKVGVALARLLSQRGYTVAAIASRGFSAAKTLAEQVGAEAVTAAEVVARAELTFLTVPDDQLAPLARQLAEDGPGGRAVVHTSGALDAGVLEPLAARGVATGSLHPAFPFADSDDSVRRLPGATFALEAADARLERWLEEIVAALDGRILRVPPGRKPLYHAALVFASNYTVTLYAVAEKLLQSLGAEREVAANALNALLEGTIANLAAQGTPDALTGPLVRGDTGTVAAHLDALERVDPRLAALYRQLAEATLPLLEARGLSTEAISASLGISLPDQE
ncbi:MAG: DUF2520 domain-containing protein [Chloroflexota bacterium]|nr:MAG: DUF2520 domain-containing protein [Chloroflexota bacterium]